MMGYAQAPAGEPIRFVRHARAEAWLRRRFAPCDYRLFESGTAALGAAVCAARTSRTGNTVALPAYGCPALVSAVRAAGAEPVLVDLERDRPWLDLDDLRRVLDAHAVVAIIAVDLFGIPERYAALRELAGARDVCLIRDAAQGLPTAFGDAAGADLVVLSFGRGKPASILSGGALLVRDTALTPLLPRVDAAPFPRTWRLKGWLYNRLLSPRLFWLPKALPWLGIGTTRYRPLPAIRRMAPALVPYLPANIAARDREMGRVAETVAALVTESGAPVTDLGRLCLAEGAAALNRYPLLTSTPAVRNALLVHLEQRGIGASAMYGETLAELPGVPGVGRSPETLPGATDFAARLLTLPLHTRLRERDFECMASALSALRCETEAILERRNENSARGRRATELHEDRPRHRRPGAGGP